MAAKTRVLTGRELFSTGTWNKLTFDENDIDGIISAFQSLNQAGTVPLKLGHVTPTPRNPERQFAMGWVNKLYKSGKRLLADLEVPERVADIIDEKFLKFVSVELAKDVQAGTRVIPWVLDAVALLGSESPAVGVLKDLLSATVSMSRRPVLRAAAHFTLKRQVSQSQSTSRTKQMDEEAVKKLLAEQKSELTVLFTKQVDEIKKAGTDALEAEKKARKTDQVNARKVSITALFTAAITAKQILPRTQEKFEKLNMKSDDAILEVKDTEVKEFIANFAEVDANDPELKKAKSEAGKGRKEGATGAGGETEDFTGKTNMQVFSVKVEKEVKRFSGKMTNSRDLHEAGKRVLRDNPKLAEAYYDAPHESYVEVA